jgi:hypothetical protein
VVDHEEEEEAKEMRAYGRSSGRQKGSYIDKTGTIKHLYPHPLHLVLRFESKTVQKHASLFNYAGR